jgi:DNA-binding IclR family transcriptional regulator
VVTIVDLLAERPHEGLTLSELARRLGLSPATCHPMLTTLTRAGWLVRHPSRRTYRLGPGLIAAGKAATDGFAALDLARPRMIELQRDLGLACLALAPSEHHATLVDIVRDPRVPGPAMRIGDQTPFHPPLGASYMAWAGADVVTAWMERGLSQPETRAHYERVLTATRERGFAVELVTAPEARVREALAEIGTASATRLRAVLAELADELAREDEFLPIALKKSHRYRVGSMSACVFDGNANVALIVALRGFPTSLRGAEVQTIGERLLAATDEITAGIAGHRPRP